MATRRDLEKIVGKERVITDKDVLKSFANDLSFLSGNVPEFVVKPQGREEIKKIVDLANKQGFPLIPCSSGEPRFRGDTVPTTSGSVVVDLSMMKNILRIDTRNKEAIVEPGVTFSELQDAAKKVGLRVVMPLLPKNTKSIVGSLLEREPVTMPKYHWDDEDPMGSTEVIFGSGDIFRTGSAAGPGTLEEQWASGNTQKIAFGPSQTSLGKIIAGAQGTMGIVTWVSIKLELLPQIERGFLVGAGSLDELIDFTYKILWRKIPDICFILNGPCLASMYGADSKEGASLAKSLPSWILVYSISGYDHFPEERIDYIEKDIEDIAAQFGVRPIKDFSGIAAEKIIGLVSKPINEQYWKIRSHGGCQDLFFLTTLDKTPEFLRVMDAELISSGYTKENLRVYIQPIRQGTGCHLEFSLQYNPGNSEEVTLVKDLFDSASKKFIDMGGFFSRPYGSWAKMAYNRCPDTVQTLKKLKEIFDPKGVLNPGKLCFQREV